MTAFCCFNLLLGVSGNSTDRVPTLETVGQSAWTRANRLSGPKVLPIEIHDPPFAH